MKTDFSLNFPFELQDRPAGKERIENTSPDPRLMGISKSKMMTRQPRTSYIKMDLW